MSSTSVGEIVEAGAIALWQDEAMRILQKPRSIEWDDESEDSKAKWRRLFLASMEALGKLGLCVVPFTPVIATLNAGYRVPQASISPEELELEPVYAAMIKTAAIQFPPASPD